MLIRLLPTSKDKLQFAKRLRQSKETSAEHRLWTQLRGHKLHGLKFRRQVALGPFIADFLCVGAKLIVELDGESHESTKAYDQRRTLYFNALGFRVVRYSNDQAFDDLEGVLEDIASKAKTKT